MEDHTFNRWVEQSAARFPDGFIDNRLKIETRKEESILSSESQFPGKWINPRALLTFALRLSLLSAKGAKNALDIKLKSNKLSVLKLPQEFIGFKILQITDPHFNDHEGFIDCLTETIKQADFDLCVLTGDYRFRSFGTSAMAMKGLAEIARIVDTKILAVLGNHDSIKMLPEMERLGMTVLLNEHISIVRGNANLLIAGVDDPRYYRTDDIHQSLVGAPAIESTPAILLAHSPELYLDAAGAGFGAYLCGHTHAGQVCLIPGKTLLKNFRSPNWTLSGCWTSGSMQGYTSAGVGTSVVNARFNCAPEMTLHELYCP